jgi:hypothetical protein
MKTIIKAPIIPAPKIYLVNKNIKSNHKTQELNNLKLIKYLALLIKLIENSLSIDFMRKVTFI